MGTSIQSVEVGKLNLRTLVKNYLDLTKLPIVLLLLFTTVPTKCSVPIELVNTLVTFTVRPVIATRPLYGGDV